MQAHVVLNVISSIASSRLLIFAATVSMRSTLSGSANVASVFDIVADSDAADSDVALSIPVLGNKG